MRPITRLAAAAIGVLALSAPAYAGDANHSAGATGALGGSSGGTLRPMPRPAGFSVYDHDFYGYNPGAVTAAGSGQSYHTTRYSNGQRVEGIMGSDGTFYATTGTMKATTSAPKDRPSSKTKDSRPSPNPNGNLGNKGASAKGKGK